jgi:alkanesulfonate monooxygenase SsuD/methylene tetrahydromethanopterin reductase-like flavin-dependent oxidoreductase (luciferase family)
LLVDRQASFAGDYYQLKDCEITPCGPREGGVPLMIGAMGPRMMRLAARHGDLWNFAYTGSADTFAEPVEKFREACKDVDRDPGTIGMSALANVVFTDLGGSPPPGIDANDIDLPESATSASALLGSDDEMVAELEKYADLGTSHLMFHCYPYTEAALDRLASVVEKYRATL